MAGKKDRQRKLARERYQRQQARRAQRAQRWRLAGFIGAAVVVVGGVTTLLIFTLGGGGKSASAAKHCTYTPAPPASRNVGTPPAKPDYKAKYRAAIKTNRGTVVADLLNNKATCTVNSFVYLASKKYFNKTSCHRLTTSGTYVLQCGDPTGTGQGGPGYKFAGENLAGATYKQGTVVMANAGPGTNGSQFFLVYKDTSLPPNYTPFGKVVSGLGIIQSVAKAGTDNANGQGDGHPKQKVVIERVTIIKA